MRLSVIVHPNSKNPRIEEDLLGMTHVHVHAPPQEGKANKEVVESLAKHFGIHKGKVTLIQGAKSKIKVFEVIPK